MTRAGFMHCRRLTAGLVLAVMLSVVVAAGAVTPAEALPQVAKDTAAATAELRRLHVRIGDARGERLRRISALRQRLQQLRQDVDTLAAAAAAKQKEATDLQRQAGAFADGIQAIGERLREYRRDIGTRLSAAEAETVDKALAATDVILAAETPATRLSAAAPLLRLAAERSGGNLRVRVFAGRALASDGSVVSGRFVAAGPVVLFAADTASGPTGPVVQRPGSTLPSVVTTALPRGARAGIRAAVAGAAAVVPVDVTLGNAGRLVRVQDDWLTHLRRGGITMIPLLILAVVAAVLAVYKLASLQFISARAPEGLMRDLLTALRQDRYKDAVELASRLHRPLAPVIREGIEYRHAPKEHIEEILYERILAQVPDLEKLLTPLAVCASVAPLLGLLGTVTGMIHTFKLITVFGAGDARLLSSGISEALVTTEAGLMIAVPALLLHAYLSRRVRKAVAATQQSAIMFVNGLKLTAPRAED